MSIFREIPPTAGWPIPAKTLRLPAVKFNPGLLANAFKNYSGIAFAQAVYSGTAAFYFLLEALKQVSQKKTVVIPAFICPLIPLAIKRASLKVKTCDIQPDNFNFAAGQLRQICSEDNDILAILAAHIAGIPLDFASIEQTANDYGGIYIIEDCAQSLGAEYQGKAAGSLGDFSFFSLCRGKSLTIYEGGIAATKQESYAPLIQETISRLETGNFISETIKMLELYGYWIFYRPQLFWFIFSLPQIFWSALGNPLKAQIEYFSEDFPLHRVSAWRQYIGYCNFTCLKRELNSQRAIADEYIRGLKDLAGVKIIIEPSGTLSNYPYLTLLFDDPRKKITAQKIFRNTGLGVSQIYALAITDYDYLSSTTGTQAAPNARSFAQRHLTLTTSSFIKQSEIQKIVSIIRELCA
ncbi:MAG: DegT/DnrJ/EryC1/StrS family aminotransferase [Candidatus Omnitrophota bacterium]